jgi:hypothetical protein
MIRSTVRLARLRVLSVGLLGWTLVGCSDSDTPKSGSIDIAASKRAAEEKGIKGPGGGGLNPGATKAKSKRPGGMGGLNKSKTQD